MNRKRRALVLTSEGARHPFRMSLPPSALRDYGEDWSDEVDKTASNRGYWRDIVSTYVVTFVGVLVFLV